ncbi:MAG: hypothetical protein AB8G95_24885 [Anaerolineae bacterium]
MKEKETIKIEIEDVIDAEKEQKSTGEKVNIEEELKNLGKQFADTIKTAWNSEEVKKVEAQVREGVKKFSEEVSNIFSDAKDSKAGQKVGDTVNKVDSTEAAQSMKKGVAQGLRWLSQELGKLSDSMTVTEKQPPKE